MADLSSPTTEAFDVFLEYHLTSMLLSLVASGQDGPQTLSEYERYESPFENSLSSRRRALNALTNLLVRNAEAVAVTTSGPSHPPSSSTSWDAPNTLEVFVMQEEINHTSLPHSTMVPSSPSNPPTPVNGPWITTIPPGQSKWAEIMASPWSCVAKPNEILSLSDHLATMEQYLNEYQLRTQPTELKSKDQSDGNTVEGEFSERTVLDPSIVRGKQFDSFFVYLISTCYPRVRRQLSSSLSTKLFSLLSSITDSQLKLDPEVESLNARVPLVWNNLHLCRVIYHAQSGDDPYDFQAMVQELKDKHYPAQNQSPTDEPGTPQKASALFEALSNTFELVKSGTLDPLQLPTLYTKETCVDFHYLLLFALNKYRDAVTQFYDHATDGRLTEKDRRDLNVYSSLLWRIAHSSVLYKHLDFLCKSIPQHFRWNDIAPNGLPHGQESKGRNGDGDIGGDENICEDEDVNSEDSGVKEEMAALERDLSHRRDPALIQKWICLLVSHLQALHLLSSFASSSPPTEIRIQLIEVRHSKFETPQDWTAVLKRTLTSRLLSFQCNELEELILAKINAAHEGKEQKGIFRYFKDKHIISGCGQVHCEAGLAAALHSPPQDTMEQYWFDGKNHLTVSRPCCPLCWELLRTLRLNRFGVQGHHSVLTPMILPGWIRRDTAEVLLDLIRNRLYKELRQLLTTNDADSEDSTLTPRFTELSFALFAQ